MKKIEEASKHYIETERKKRERAHSCELSVWYHVVTAASNFHYCKTTLAT